MILINILLSIVVIALLCLLQNYFNIKKEERIKQFLSIPISILLMIVGIILWYFIADKVHEIFTKVEFFKNVDVLFMNLTLLVGFIPIKIALKLLLPTICKNESLIQHFSLGFYNFDEEYEKWFIQKKWERFRQYFFSILIACVFFGSVFLGLTWALGSESALWVYVFPCAAIVIINEIYAFINGQTKEEFKHNIIGDEADSRRISNFYKLREILENILPEPLLSSTTGCEFTRRETPADLLKKLDHSSNTIDNDVARYFNQNDRYKTADVDCVQATLQMMHRNNVVFFNPFYKDLGDYITLPLTKSLLSGKKCVVLCGRKSASKDAKLWIEELLKKYSRINGLWRVDNISDQEPNCEVGILTFTQLYDKRVITQNKDFFKETDFVLLIEPSIMLNTSQIALSIIAEKLSDDNDKSVFCICDRYSDGLIDTMSHLLHTEITNVVAMPVPHCNYSAMSWNVDGDFCRQNLFDKQTKYLGNGIELAAIAIKNQVPKVSWYSERKAPIKDIKWIAGQNYATLCRYMNLPIQQKNLYEKIDFVSNLWCTPKSKEQFVIAEDEFCNMFGMMRTFLTRGENQIFVNILSENYLLRDYMRCNRQMFMSNPNAIPSFIPDYAKTERNTIIKLLLMMAMNPVSEEEILRELNVTGIDTSNVFETLSKLLRKYTFADSSIFTIKVERTNVDKFLTVKTIWYSIIPETFDKYFSKSLKNAYFILEDEKIEEGYIDAKLFGHVTQMVLPGQFVTYDGKYYIVKYISPQNGVVLRRASDLYDRRKYYRQIRNYHFEKIKQDDIISYTKISDIEFVVMKADFEVTTTGYIELTENHNLRTAKNIDLKDDPSAKYYNRKFRNKSILRIKLPETDEKLLFTLCLLLSEVFKTIYPDGWQYLSALTIPEDEIEGMLNYVVYSTTGDIEKGYIYIVEDSDLDLGLLESFEKNFIRIMEIIADFLDWHFEKIREPATKDPLPKKVSQIEYEEKKKRNLIERMFDRVRRLFGGKQEEEVKLINPNDSDNNDEKSEHTQNEADMDAVDKVEEDYSLDQNSEEKDDTEETIAPIDEDSIDSDDETPDYSLESDELNEDHSNKKENTVLPITDNAEVNEEESFEPENADDPDLVAIDGTDIFENEGMPEDNEYLERCFESLGIVPITKSRYQKECYLKYGFEEIDGRIQIDELRKYLRVRGWCNNLLTLARKRDVFERKQIDINAVNHCDFCAQPLTGVSYERLNDGRIRCNNCSSSAITTIEELQELFQQCLEMMEAFYDIKYRVPVNVKMTDARTIAKGAGMLFKPSTGYTSRVLGYAQKKNGRYNVLMENGSPRLAAIDTMVHEMTHIWQFLNWNDDVIRQIYKMGQDECTSIAREIVYEGMSMWSSIQYLYLIGETYYASNLEISTENRGDVYGIGFRLYREQYPFVKDFSILKYSPFASFPTLEPSDVIKAVKANCQNEECLC